MTTTTSPTPASSRPALLDETLSRRVAPPQGTEPQPELLAVIRSGKREIVVVAASSSRHPVSHPDVLAESDTRAGDGFDMNCVSAPTKEPTHE